MKLKRISALMLAAVMTVGGATTVMADPLNTATGGGTTITGEGKVDYVNTKIYSVTLPTTAAMDLTIDPQGLTGLENGKTATLKELEDYAGLVASKGKALVTNCSSVKIKVSVELLGTGSATFVDSAAAVEAEGENILLYALPSAVDVQDNADNYEASTTGVLISTGSGTTLDFVLEPAEYVVSKSDSGALSYKPKDGQKGHGTAISFEGAVNKDADWSAYSGAAATKTIGMTAVFTYDADLDGAVADTTEGAPYGMVAMGSGTITVAAKAKAPSIGATGTYNKATGVITATVNLGTGAKATTLKSAKYGSSSDGATNEVVSPKIEGTTFTGSVSSSVKSGWSSKAAGSTVYAVITLDDGTSEAVALTVQ